MRIEPYCGNYGPVRAAPLSGEFEMEERQVDPARLVQVAVPYKFQKQPRLVWVLQGDLESGVQFPNTYSVHGTIKTQRGSLIPIDKDTIIKVML